jgi:hypothetical protein
VKRLFLTLSLFFCSFVSADESRYNWQLDESYAGSHQDSYRKLLHEIPILMRQTLIDIAGRTGLNFQEGWSHPINVGFTDDAPYGAENVLAYVQLLQTADGIEQELRINLPAYDHENFNFDKVFAHELTHAMLNDALGGAAAHVIPVWFHEGLAVYTAGQGEQMLKSYVYANSGFASERILNGLDGPHGALDYAEDYLAFGYIERQYGTTGVHAFIQETLRRKGDVVGALDYALHETWADFERNVHAYGEEEIKRIGPAKRGQYEKPY